jgi:hypothetical protein
MQLVPLALSRQVTQVPLEPHLSQVRPSVHFRLSGSQQPFPQAVWLASPHEDSQRWVVVLHDSRPGQSLATVQPQPMARHFDPVGAFVQSRHELPYCGSAHAVWLVPLTQLEPLQQPPLHSVLGSQLVEQVGSPVGPKLHAWLTGQSVTCWQPHLPPPDTAKQIGPWPLVAHGTHAPPVAPQAAGLVPLAQEPALQQPLLHGCPAEQDVVQVCVVPSQALPVGQSAADEQPHFWPNRQVWPLAEPLQSLHIPLLPHDDGEVPSTHFEPSQQPVEHSWVEEHAVVQACITRSHEWPAAQSAALLQPQAPPPVTATQAVPSALPAQLTHRPPCAPHAAGSVPAAHEPPAQQPPEHGCVIEHALEHACDDAQARPGGQSVALLQPQTDERHRWPAVLLVQSLHAPPVGPQASGAVPAAHIPLAQQLPAHGCETEQDVVQVCVVPSQALPVGQSALVAQPQWPPPVAATHWLPMLEPAHGTHALPSSPQAATPVPPMQVPFWQQPPAHGAVGPQVVVHCPPLQACPAGQSAATLQPQVPPTQAWPALLLVQSAHTPTPHALDAIGCTHTFETQQALAHGCETEQVVTHTCVVPSQDRPFGHWLELEQAHAPPPATDMQCCEPQSAHMPPAPHAESPSPATQLPAALQQPPLHGWPALHEGVHRCRNGSHERPVGQSVTEAQPQPPFMHTRPVEPAVQSRHAPPAPQEVEVVPPMQAPFEQQPP